MESLGQKIRQRRMERKMTQTQLAEGLVSASAISQIESDKINPSYKLLCQIAERLEVPLDYFIADKEEYLEQTTSHKLAKTLISAKEYAKAIPILENLANTGSVDELDLLKDLATCHLQMKNFFVAHPLLEKVMHLSLKEKDNQVYVWSLNYLGFLFYHQNNISLAVHYWQKGYEYIEEVEAIDPYIHARLITNLAIAHNRLGNYDQSSKLFGESHELLKNSTDLHLLATNYLGLGESFYRKKQFKMAEEYCQEAITIFKNLDHLKYSIRVKENFAIMRGENGDYEEALQMLGECLSDYKEHNFESYSSNAHSEVAKILIKLSRFDEAEQHIKQAFAHCEADSAYHAQSYFVRSLWQLAMQRHEEAIQDGKKSAELYLANESIHEYSQVCLHLSDIYKKMEDYKSSTEILEQSQRSIQTYFRERGVII